MKKPTDPFIDPSLMTRWVEFANELVLTHGYAGKTVADASLVASAQINALVYGEDGMIEKFALMREVMARETAAKKSAVRH